MAFPHQFERTSYGQLYRTSDGLVKHSDDCNHPMHGRYTGEVPTPLLKRELGDRFIQIFGDEDSENKW